MATKHAKSGKRDKTQLTWGKFAELMEGANIN
jgi:hypothetical protein